MASYGTKDNQSLWTHSSFVIFNEVQQKKLPVDLRCGISLDGRGCVEVVLSGLFSELENNSVTYVIDQLTPLPGKGSEDGKSCSFSFILDRQYTSGGIEKLNFSGRGTVVEVKKNAAGKPEQLLLRLAPNLVTSKVRRERRISWKAGDTKVLWCIAMPDLPEKMNNLRERIAAHYNAAKSSISVELKDISASGACARVMDNSYAQKYAPNDYHMLFFVPMNAAGQPPFTILGKRVGANRKDNGGSFLLPLHFYYELDWGKSGQTLTWVYIQHIGSERMRHFLKSRSGDTIRAPLSGTQQA
ncbi:MAG: hypothetical protein LBN96_06755 [Desulfovibrio sp.]|jgi:hypothetical protein|nr:hypothetical protein [Desulfovibrio sp.]